MRVGIIELLVDKRLDGPLEGLYGLFLRKQFVSIGRKQSRFGAGNSVMR